MARIATIWNDLFQWVTSLKTIEQIALITAALAVLIFLINFGIKPLVSFLIRLQNGLSVKMGISQVIEKNTFYSAARAHYPILTCTIINKGTTPVFIQKPSIKANQKIDSFNIFSVVNPVSFPIKLEQGEVFNFECNAVDLEQQVLYKLQPLNTIQFIVFTSTGKSYSSNSYPVHFIRSNIRSAENINRNNPKQS